MSGTNSIILPETGTPSVSIASTLPRLIDAAGTAAAFAWDEFFNANIRNPHTRTAYRRTIDAARGHYDTIDRSAGRALRAARVLRQSRRGKKGADCP